MNGAETVRSDSLPGGTVVYVGTNGLLVCRSYSALEYLEAHRGEFEEVDEVRSPSLVEMELPHSHF